MRSTIRGLAALASVASLVAPALAQTFTNCNPTLTSTCPPDSALGKTVSIDFRSASDSFTPQGNPTYGSDGVSFKVAKSGDSPQLTSKWYIMFGQVDVEVKAAPGAGIVSSFVMQSDCLDEIDWEWLGGDNAQVLSNYFSKGQTTTYNRGAFHANAGNQNGFQKYTIIWTAEQTVWQINGVTVRTLKPADASGQYPQTPMQIKLGAWSGGDAANAPGTIQWAGGPTDYTKGPFVMSVKSLKVQDYSTGTQYVYGDQTGTWGSIKSVGGKINAGGSPVQGPAPAITSSANGQPIPFTPGSTTTYTKPSVYPWVPDSTMATVPQATYGNYPGLPSGWSVSDTGKVIAPSLAPSTSPAASPTPSPLLSSSAPSAASERVIKTYDDRGFTTFITIPAARITTPAVAVLPSASVLASASVLPSTSVRPSANAAVVNNPAPSASGAGSLLVSGRTVCMAALVGALFVLL